MGLILPQTVKVKTHSSNCKYYKENGYNFKKCGDFIDVDILDLHPGSKAMVKCICDICSKEVELLYSNVMNNIEANKLICCHDNSCRNKKIENTCMNKYGVKSTNQLKTVKDKKTNTCQKKYGVDNPGQAQEVKNKMKATCQEKYNCDYAIRSKEVREKSIETSKKLYGVEHPMQSKAIQDKAKETCRDRYGVDYPGQSEEVKDKIKQTCQQRYGVDSIFQSEEIKSKVKQTCQQRYGVDYAFQAEEVKDKIKQACQQHYGVDYACQAEEVKDKIKQTNNEKYGCDYASQSEEIKNRIRETNNEKYGGNAPACSKEVQNKMKETNNKKYGGNGPACSEEVRRKMQQTMLKKHGVKHALQNKELLDKALDSFQFNGTGPSSRAQRYICHILNGILNKRMCGSLVDIYLEKENIIIEHDGSGHFLGDIINGNALPTEESLLREKQRENKIINNGHKMIRFIATKDRIPSDETIINLIEGFKNSEFKVIRIDFEEGTIDRDYGEKWHCNFGKLRKITKEDLEPFEKQEEDTSKNVNKI